MLCENTDNVRFIDLIASLERINMSMKAHVGVSTKGYIESLLKGRCSPRALRSPHHDPDIPGLYVSTGGPRKPKNRHWGHGMDMLTKAAIVFVAWADNELEETGSG